MPLGENKISHIFDLLCSIADHLLADSLRDRDNCFARCGSDAAALGNTVTCGGGGRGGREGGREGGGREGRGEGERVSVCV